MNLDSLSEEQLAHIVDVVAKDLEFKSSVINDIHQQEKKLKKLLSRSYEVSKRRVSLNPFQIFHRSVVCTQCGRLIYSRKSSDRICELCYQLRVVETLWKTFDMICPYNECQFGYAKLAYTNYANIAKVDWALRAKIEMHISHLLKTDIDQASVLEIDNAEGMQKAKESLLRALEQYDGSIPFVYIDDAITMIQKSILKAKGEIRISSICPKTSNYFQIFTNAVITIMVSRKGDPDFAGPKKNFRILEGTSASEMRSQAGARYRRSRKSRIRKGILEIVPQIFFSQEALQVARSPQHHLKKRNGQNDGDDDRETSVRELKAAKTESRQSVQTGLVVIKTNAQMLSMVDGLLNDHYRINRTYAPHLHTSQTISHEAIEE